MQTLPLIASWREGALIAGAIVGVILLLWFVARLSHRPYFVLGQSETMHDAVLQIGRLADAMNRVAQALENQTRIEERHSDAPIMEEKQSGMSLSMFGR